MVLERLVLGRLVLEKSVLAIVLVLVETVLKGNFVLETRSR